MKYFFYTRTRGLFRNCYPKERPPVSAGKWIHYLTGNFMNVQKRYFTCSKLKFDQFCFTSLPLHFDHITSALDFHFRHVSIDSIITQIDWQSQDWSAQNMKKLKWISLSESNYYFFHLLLLKYLRSISIVRSFPSKKKKKDTKKKRKTFNFIALTQFTISKPSHYRSSEEKKNCMKNPKPKFFGFLLQRALKSPFSSF